MKKAFTLAEVLITLGIIGIVAAMTLPVLIQSYRNHIVETRLKKFYSTVNQAIIRAEAKYGDKKYWYEDVSGVELDEDGNPIESTAKIDIWFQTYLSDFIVIKKIIETSGVTKYYLTDGSAFQFGNDDNVLSSRAVVFFPSSPDSCPDEGYGICKFYFMFYPLINSEIWKYHYNKGLEPCKYKWDGKAETLQKYCYEANGGHYSKYCTALIQLNQWHIPKDYPYKVY